uniref:Uncharacterized protein n=1 Tax=Kalanchoe fedtschenkoi TaxID=63787 RepID=A0A7N0TAD4_KALFE
MDRLVVADVKEVDITFKRKLKSSASFRLTNLMHTMPVAVSLVSSNPTTFSFSHPFSVIPPLSTSTFVLQLTQISDKPPTCAASTSSSSSPTITVRSSMLPTGKGNADELKRLFSRPGPHVFKDAVLPVTLVGPDMAEFMIGAGQSETLESVARLRKSIGGCSVAQLTTLLRIAVANGKGDFSRVLIDAGADVNWRGPGEESLVSLAVKSGSVEILLDLIASGAKIDQSTDLVLHEAARMNSVELMEVLVQGFPEIDPCLVDVNGQNAIHVSARLGDVEAIKFLISIGGDADVADANGYTPLHFAAAEGCKEAVELLLDACSFVKYAVTKDKKTAFVLAVDDGHSHLFDVLHIGDALLKAAAVGDEHMIKRCLADGADVNGRDQNGWTPLHRAAFKGKVESVKVLVGGGAKVDAVDDAGYTPLHCAIEAGHVEVATFLVAHGASGQLKSVKGIVSEKMVECFKGHPALASPLICKNRDLV